MNRLVVRPTRVFSLANQKVAIVPRATLVNAMIRKRQLVGMKLSSVRSLIFEVKTINIPLLQLNVDCWKTDMSAPNQHSHMTFNATTRAGHAGPRIEIR